MAWIWVSWRTRLVGGSGSIEGSGSIGGLGAVRGSGLVEGSGLVKSQVFLEGLVWEKDWAQLGCKVGL